MEEYSPRKIYSSCYSKHWTVRLQAEGEENNKKEEQIEAEKDKKTLRNSGRIGLKSILTNINKKAKLKP